MQPQYNWIADQLAQGRTVLAYDRKSVPKKVHHIKSMRRVAMVGDMVHVDGIAAKGWTFAAKPSPKA